MQNFGKYQLKIFRQQKKGLPIGKPLNLVRKERLELSRLTALEPKSNALLLYKP